LAVSAIGKRSHEFALGGSETSKFQDRSIELLDRAGTLGLVLVHLQQSDSCRRLFLREALLRLIRLSDKACPLLRMGSRLTEPISIGVALRNRRSDGEKRKHHSHEVCVHVV